MGYLSKAQRTEDLSVRHLIDWLDEWVDGWMTGVRSEGLGQLMSSKQDWHQKQLNFVILSITPPTIMIKEVRCGVKIFNIRSFFVAFCLLFCCGLWNSFFIFAVRPSANPGIQFPPIGKFTSEIGVAATIIKVPSCSFSPSFSITSHKVCGWWAFLARKTPRRWPCHDRNLVGFRAAYKGKGSFYPVCLPSIMTSETSWNIQLGSIYWKVHQSLPAVIHSSTHELPCPCSKEEMDAPR